MFGTKVNLLQTKASYTLEELFDAIKAERFTAGKPRFTHQGLVQLIVFPAVDVDNQVRVFNATVSSPSSTFCVRRDEQVGAIADGDSLGGWDEPRRERAANAELCELLAEKTCRELEELGL